MLVVSGLLLVVSLWPPVGSLYELTGEDNLLAQLRGVVHWVNTAVRPQPQLAPETIPDNTNVVPYGVNTFLEQEAEIEKRAVSLQMARQAGFEFIRQEFVWEDIEIHGKGDFEDRRHEPFRSAWEKYDNIVDLAEADDIEIIARLSNPPAWSRALPVGTTGTLAPPDNYDDFGDFAAAVAERYNGRIRYYQLWNEPNGNGEWGNHQPVNPEQYTELLCTAYRRIKEVNPGAVVLAGALTPTVAINDGNLNDLIFLERMYAAGAGDCFDVMSAQGYGLWSGALDQRLKPNVINYPHNLYLRDVMVRHGYANKPIWISELGWNVVPDGLDTRSGQVTPEQQARFAVEAYERAQSEWPWVGVVNYWFLKRKDDSELDQSFYYFRLLDADFTPQPVYEALSESLPQMAEPVPQAGGVYDWMAIRPYLFIPSFAILFFALLRWLTPDESES
ncbi:MAG: cellulase family glycosylhydrolase [Anaerolineales bacterium]|nr:cellulase family glycosylhydrolase [Anaerolineales bacterium]